MSEIKKRSLFGLIYIIIMLSFTYFSKLTFHVLFIFIGLFCLKELSNFRLSKNEKNKALMYVVLPMILVHFLERNIILNMYILTWTFDSFAFLIGKKIGNRKINTKISPNKSWEGFLAGFIFTQLTCLLIIYSNENLEVSKLIFISLIIPFTATIGDFIESYFKRLSGLKDSGKIIPGHGGLLDRVDSFMITIPIIFLIIFFK